MGILQAQSGCFPVAVGAVVWYCKILSVLCLYDMGQISRRETRCRIKNIISIRQEKLDVGHFDYPLPSCAKWDFLLKRTKMGCLRRGFSLPPRIDVRNLLEETVMDRDEPKRKDQ